MASIAGRDILVVLREELGVAREMLAEVALLTASEREAVQLEVGAPELERCADALDARIHAPFDGVLLNRAATTFRAAAVTVRQQLEARAMRRRSSKETHNLVHRLAACAQSVMRAGQRNALAVAMQPLTTDEGWLGAPLNQVVHLVDVVSSLARRRLGEGLEADKLESLLNRAVSTVVVSSLHAVNDVVKRAGDPIAMSRDRYGLLKALEPSSRQVASRLGEWFSLDAQQVQLTLVPPVDLFVQALVDRLIRA